MAKIKQEPVEDDVQIIDYGNPSSNRRKKINYSEDAEDDTYVWGGDQVGWIKEDKSSSASSPVRDELKGFSVGGWHVSSGGSTKRGRPGKHSGLACPICNFKTLQQSLFEEHVRLHNDKVVFNCPHCPAIFTQKGNLQAHIRTHTKDRPFTCQYCKFAASQRGNLVAHLRTHTKEKPFKCRHCDYATAQSGNLQSHLLRRHGGNSPNFPAKSGAFNCSFCEFSCRRKSLFVSHCQTLHSKSVVAEDAPVPSHFMDVSG